MEARQIRHALGPDEHGGQGLDRHPPRDLVHPPEAREREENGAVVGAPGRSTCSDHRHRLLGHFFSLVEAVADPQARAPCRLGAQQRLVGGPIRSVVVKEPPFREGERLSPPRERREIRRPRRHVAKSLEGVSQLEGHGRVDPRVLLQAPEGSGENVRRRDVHAEDDAQHELGWTALCADHEVVVGGPLDKPFLDPPGEENARDDQTDRERDGQRRQDAGDGPRPKVFDGDGEDRHRPLDPFRPAVLLISAISRTRSASPITESSCETMSSVFSAPRHTARNAASTSLAVVASRLAHGSSAKSTGGSFASARAIATRCCSPRESCCGLWERREPRPSPARRSAARPPCSPLETASANIMASITFSSALRAESRLNVWNTYPRRSALNRSRRASGRAEISIPSTWMVPAVGTETPAIRLRSVVLPEPLRPRRTVQDPAGRLRPSMSRTSSVFRRRAGTTSSRSAERPPAARPCRYATGTRWAGRHGRRPARDHDVIGWRSG